MIVDVHADDPEFGYRFIADELEAAGQRSCERRVWRLCREQRVWSTKTRKGRRSHGKTPGPAVHDDLVRRVFSAPAPDVLWLTDITEHPTLEDKLYCCSIKDVFSNRIVGYAFGPRMTAQLTVRAPRSHVVDPRARSWFTPTAAARSDPERFEPRSKPTGSSDRWDALLPLLTTPRWNQSFDALLQKNVLNRRTRWRTRNELASEIIVWTEHTYNRRRRQRALGKLSPVAYELAYVSPPCLEDNELAA